MNKKNDSTFHNSNTYHTLPLSNPSNQNQFEFRKPFKDMESNSINSLIDEMMTKLQIVEENTIQDQGQIQGQDEPKGKPHPKTKTKTKPKVKRKLVIKPKKTQQNNKVEATEATETTEKNSIQFTSYEFNLYAKQKNKAKFSSPEDEYKWALPQLKKCSKCFIEKSLTEYGGNTSGTDGFDRNGYRLRRPECKICTKAGNDGKNKAKKLAKEAGIPYKAPEGTLCAICQKEGKPGDMLVFDHDHVEEKFRGYCHNSCNRSLGVLGDDVDGMLRALNYLIISSSNPASFKIIQNADGTLSKIE